MKKALSFVLALLLAATLVVALCGCYSKGDEVLSMRYKDDFKIVVLADIQMNYMEEVEETFLHISEVLAAEKPDLIVLTGDQTFAKKYNRKQAKELFEAWVSRIDAYNIPWAVIFGNHDDYRMSKGAMAKRFAQAKNCLFSKGPNIKGVGNYVINLVDDNGKPVRNLYLFDSNTYRLYPNFKITYDFVHKNQIKWYEQCVNSFTEQNGGKPVPSLAFMHIPMPEYAEALMDWTGRTWKQMTDGDSFDEVGDIKLTDATRGWATVFEAIACPQKNSGLFQKMVELGSTKAVYSAHDHKNNGELNWKGVQLCYAVKSSDGDYGGKEYQGWMSITLHTDGTHTNSYHYFYPEIRAEKLGL